MLTMPAPRGCSQATGGTPSMLENWRRRCATPPVPLLKMKQYIVSAALGRDPQETATAFSNLALTYKSLARYIEAEQHYQRAIEIGEKVFGEHHQYIAIWYNNFA